MLPHAFKTDSTWVPKIGFFVCCGLSRPWCLVLDMPILGLIISALFGPFLRVSCSGRSLQRLHLLQGLQAVQSPLQCHID